MKLEKRKARRLWIHAQKLDVKNPFGPTGPKAITAAIEHLGYVQIDTINVIERCHHHILYNRIPKYKRSDLYRSQTIDKSIFEYWTHALSFVATKDFSFFLNEMKRIQQNPGRWFSSVTKQDMKKVFELIEDQGPLSIRDINDDVLVEKTHAWGSRKPSKKALSLAFYCGRLVVSERQGMLKKYDLTERHFGWDKMPKAASERKVNEYILERSLRSQCLVSLDSICHLAPQRKPAIHKIISSQVNKGELIPIQIEGIPKNTFWARPQSVEVKLPSPLGRTHILSPFDPLIIQRKRLKAFFDYDHLFEAYIPKEKRQFGYFGLPVLIDDEIVAVLDLKTDRQNQKLLMQKWSWISNKSSSTKTAIEEELHCFEKFQLA